MCFVSTFLHYERIIGINWFGIGALNWITGETVAIKQIQMVNIPKSQLGEIMVS